MSDEFDELDPLGHADGEAGADYEVGYGKPPRHGVWSKGRSGNPKGRPKEVINLVSSIDTMFGEIDVTVSGGRVMSKKEGMVRTLWDQACKCDRNAFAKFLRLLKKAGLLEPLQPAPQESARSGRSGSQDMKQFKAEFGKPMPTTADEE